MNDNEIRYALNLCSTEKELLNGMRFVTRRFLNAVPKSKPELEMLVTDNLDSEARQRMKLLTQEISRRTDRIIGNGNGRIEMVKNFDVKVDWNSCERKDLMNEKNVMFHPQNVEWKVKKWLNLIII